MVVLEKYCDKCGERSKFLKNVNGMRLCPKCRGIVKQSEEGENRLERLKRLWGIKEKQ